MDVEATFKNGEDQTHRWCFNNVDPDQSGESIYQALRSLTTAKLFDEAGIEIFKAVIDAAFVKTTETVIFGTPTEADYEDEEQEATMQSFEELLTQEANERKLTVAEKVDMLLEQRQAGTRLKGFRFEMLIDLEAEESDKQPQVILRTKADCHVVKR